MITLLVKPPVDDIVYDALLADWHQSNQAYEITVKNFLVNVLEPFNVGTRLNILYNGQIVLDVPLDKAHQYENRLHIAGLAVVLATVYPPTSSSSPGLAMINFTPEINNVVI